MGSKARKDDSVPSSSLRDEGGGVARRSPGSVVRGGGVEGAMFLVVAVMKSAVCFPANEDRYSSVRH